MTNWVEGNAAVKSSLSTRARTLSTRRTNKIRGEGHDLSGQDQSMENRESGLWVPAEAHAGRYDEEGSVAESVDEGARGREEERVVA